jgi:hypothetical protein
LLLFLISVPISCPGSGFHSGSVPGELHNTKNSISYQRSGCNKNQQKSRSLLRVSLNAEETVTVFPALFFYPKAGGRRLKH